MRYAFITCLPRSRSAWLANLFTFGSSFCLHDATKETMSAKGVVDSIARIETDIPGLDFILDSDSGLPFCAFDVVDAFPQAKWVFIVRDRVEAEKSCVKFLQGSERYSDCDPTVIHNSLVAAEVNISGLKDFIPPYQWMEVRFEDLDDLLVLKQIWEFLTPSNPWCAERVKMLDTFQVNVMPDKVKVSA